MDRSNNNKLREQLAALISQGNAFTPLPQLLDSIPYEVTGQQVEGFSHTVWELTEHLRIALHDLVEYSKDSHFQSPPWPDGFWPDEPGLASREGWDESVRQIKALQEEMIEMVLDPANDLFEPFVANPDHHLLRQATIVAEHNAYHAGQIAMLSKALGRRVI
ncbi:MAG: DinB family protein [Bacteroidales bacterium]|nr:DinB family protein [Bacteroidales bacterium]